MIVRYLRVILVGLMVVVGSSLVARAQIGEGDGPVIDVWYGTNQTFGQIGMPVPFINILGNVSDLDAVAELTYSLNGGPPNALSMGPDQLRLTDLGDFNIEIDAIELVDGVNTVEIVATDAMNNTTTEQVEVLFASGNVWPQPYSIEWDEVSNIQDVAQILDGHWTLTSDGVSPLQQSYDRLIAIGDLQWTDYEVTVPITVNSIDTSGFVGPSKGAAVGVLLRWPGHADVDGSRPREGWHPHGAAGLLRWEGDPLNPTTSIQIFGNQQRPYVLTDMPQTIDFFVTYIFKMRVSTLMVEPPTGGLPVPNSLYEFKVWQEGQPEPASWTLSVQEGPDDVQAGSLLLLAHHVDCVFGNVSIEPLN
jgi:hypothetical protein